MIELELRNDVYRRPLATALDRLGLREGWRCADIGAGGGDVTVALARIVGRDGRIYAVDSDPSRRDEVAAAAAEAGQAQVIALTQTGEELVLPEPVDLAYCRFLLLHVHQPVMVQEPITSSGRIDGTPFSAPEARHPDVGAVLPALVLEAGLELVDAWAEAPAWAGPGPVADYVEALTEVDPGTDPVVLPPLVTVVCRRPLGPAVG
jgi:SAM-dependent methyltransferase